VQPREGTDKSIDKERVIMVAAIVAMVVMTGVCYNYVILPLITPRYPWLFKGAYAVYTGKTILLFFPFQYNLRIEVLDFNATHVKMLYYAELESPMSVKNSTIQWLDLNRIDARYGPLLSLFSDQRSQSYPSTIAKRSEADIYLKAVGMRHCTVYEYVNPESKYRILLHIDNKTSWILEIKFIGEYSFSSSSKYTFEFTLDLVETNIPGLKAG